MSRIDSAGFLTFVPRVVRTRLAKQNRQSPSLVIKSTFQRDQHRRHVAWLWRNEAVTKSHSSLPLSNNVFFTVRVSALATELPGYIGSIKPLLLWYRAISIEPYFELWMRRLLSIIGRSRTPPAQPDKTPEQPSGIKLSKNTLCVAGPIRQQGSGSHGSEIKLASDPHVVPKSWGRALSFPSPSSPPPHTLFSGCHATINRWTMSTVAKSTPWSKCGLRTIVTAVFLTWCPTLDQRMSVYRQKVRNP